MQVLIIIFTNIVDWIIKNIIKRIFSSGQSTSQQNEQHILNDATNPPDNNVIQKDLNNGSF